MTLQWTTPVTNFSPRGDYTLRDQVNSGGTAISLEALIGFDWEGTDPSEAAVLGWFDSIKTALEADGWTNVVVTHDGTAEKTLEDV